MQSIDSAIRTVYQEYLKVGKNESVLILADTPKAGLAFQFYQMAIQFSPAVSLHLLPPILHAGCEPDASIAALMRKFDILILMTSRSLSHTEARRKASRRGARIISMPNLQEDSLRRAVQWPARPMLDMSRKIADILNIGQSIHLTTQAGTDLTCSIAKMKGFADTGLVHDAGRFANLPAGEGCAAPARQSANGVVIIDGSFPEIGLIQQPIRVSVKNGYASRITGQEEAVKMRQMLKPFGKQGRNIAEIGIGTNPWAKVTGFTLEDEKTLGTVHVAFGNNISFEGKNNVKCHFDAILLKPTLVIDGKTILKDGKMQV